MKTENDKSPFKKWGKFEKSNRLKKVLLLLIVLLFLSFEAEAVYKQTCVVRYMTQSGWSKKYTVDVNFLSGYELNQATKSYRYSSYSVYAVIFWGQGQASVIKISTYLSCGTEVEKSCITNTVGDLMGKDQDDDEWKICVSDYCY